MVAAVVLTTGPAAAAATNLIANPGFETSGGQATVFSDSLPDLAAWTVPAGSFTVAGGVMTPATAGGTDLAVVTGSADYSDGTFQALATPVTGKPGPYGGIVFRYRDPGDHYECAVSRTAVTLFRSVAGLAIPMAISALSVHPGTPVWLQAVATGSALNCRVLTDAGGAPGTLQASAAASDGTYQSGMVGVFDTNLSGGGHQFLAFSAPRMTASVPSAWTGIQMLAGRPGEVPDTVAPANSGNESMQIFGGSTSFDGDSQQAGIAAFGSATYTLQAAIRTEGVTGGRARVEVVESPGGAVTTLGNVSGTSPWTVYSTTFTTQPGTTSVTVRTRLSGSGTANFDDLSLTVAPFVSLALSNSALDLGTVSPVGSPFTYPGAVTATVTSDSGWALQGAGGGNFNDGSGQSLPLSALAWSRAGWDAFTPFATAPFTIATGAATGVGGTAVSLDYRLTVTYADPSSARPYSALLTYVATTP